MTANQAARAYANGILFAKEVIVSTIRSWVPRSRA